MGVCAPQVKNSISIPNVKVRTAKTFTRLWMERWAIGSVGNVHSAIFLATLAESKKKLIFLPSTRINYPQLYSAQLEQNNFLLKFAIQ